MVECMKKNRLSILFLLSAFLFASCGGETSSSSASEMTSSTTSAIVSTEESESSSTAVSSSPVSSSSESSSSSSASSSQASSSGGGYNWNVNYDEYGKTFQNTLASLINKMNPGSTTYKNCLNVGAKAAAYPTASSSKFIPFYHAPEASQVATTSECNREHTWPNSRGGGSIEKDPLVIRPTLTKDNSSRSNYFYGIGSKQWDPASCGYEGARGESARIILYAATRYASLGLSLSNNPSDSTSQKTMGTLKTLLEWNNAYAPTEFEKTVNQRYDDMGYARNPFVDCPDFANYIYDSNGYRTSAYQGAAVNAEQDCGTLQFVVANPRLPTYLAVPSRKAFEIHRAA